ncbi:MAG TPA: hypothetical protein VGD53_23970 [Actinoallomurus sp.]|jgi:hypothetical protein
MARSAGTVRIRIARVALVLLAAEALYQGIWAQWAPRSFYDDFPVGLGWVRTGGGVYNAHLLRDVGGFASALGILALVAAIAATTPLLIATALAWLVYAVPHFVYHADHPLPSMQAWQVVALATQVLLPLIALIGLASHQR